MSDAPSDGEQNPAGRAETVTNLRSIVGDSHVLVNADVSCRSDSWPPTAPMEALCIVRPADTDEVSRVLAYCNGVGLSVVPQGGRTGLAGGARTCADDVALSLERLRGIAPVDRHGGTVVVGAGVPLQALQDAVRADGLYYPVDLGARGSATIGGTIATNAGGNSVFRYGMTRDQVLGVEAVLADGTVVSSMNRLVKNNTGYDLKQLFIGSEGTLGVVTRVVLRLRPHPGERATAFIGLKRFEDVLALLLSASADAEGALTSFEVMWPSFIETVLKGGRHTLPLGERHAFYVLVEIASRHSTELLENAVGNAWEAGIITDAVLAQSLAQADAFWAMRDDIDALTSAMKPVFMYDVSLPQTDMDSYVSALRGGLEQRWPAAECVVFGHIADGNLHVFIGTSDADDHAEVDALVYELLRPMNGSVSAEHGVGLEKRAYLDVSRSAVEIAVMRRLKDCLDPRGTLNPGKILS